MQIYCIWQCKGDGDTFTMKLYFSFPEQPYLIFFIKYASYCSCYYNICIILDGFCCVSEKNNASLVIIYITVIKMNVLQIA